MKKFKRVLFLGLLSILAVFSIMMTTFGIYACKKGPNADAILEAAYSLKDDNYISYGEGDDNKNVRDNIILKEKLLPSLEGKNYEVKLLWQSSDDKVISTSGDVYRPSDSDKEIKLTATLTYLDKERKRDFNLTVLKEEKEPETTNECVITYNDIIVPQGIDTSTNKVKAGSEVLFKVVIMDPEKELDYIKIDGKKDDTIIVDNDEFKLTIKKDIKLEAVLKDITTTGNKEVDKFKVLVDSDSISYVKFQNGYKEGTELEKDSKVSFKVESIPNNKELDRVLVAGSVITPQGDVYTILLTKDVEIKVILKDIVIPIPPQGDKEAVIEYRGGTTLSKNELPEKGVDFSNLVTTDKNFEVLSNECGIYKNVVGFNKDNTIRIYSDRETGEGNILTINIKDNNVITFVEIYFGEGKNLEPAKNPKAKITLGSDIKEYDDCSKFQNTTLSYKDLNIKTLKIQNAQKFNQSGSTQLWIEKIIIRYKASKKTDQDKLNEDLSNLNITPTILCKEEDTILLPPNGNINLSDITWELENNEYLKLDNNTISVIKLPTDSNKEIKLKASLSLNDARGEKEFTLIANKVLSNLEKLNKDKEALILIQDELITEILTIDLPDKGECFNSNITWQSSNETIISNIGKVLQLPESETEVKLIATLTLGSDSVSKEFAFRVKKIIKYTVSFDLNGGSGVFDDVKIVSGKTVNKPSAKPTKAGYNFLHWELNGSEFDFNTPITSNITLIAVWEEIPQEQSITYDFSKSSTAQGSAVTDESLKTLFDGAKDGDDIISSITETNKIFDGNAQGGNEYASTPGLIKMGKTKEGGKFTINFTKDIKKIKVELVSWKVGDRLEINSTSFTPAKDSNSLEKEIIEFTPGSPTNKITFSTPNKHRVLIFKIKVYY